MKTCSPYIMFMIVITVYLIISCVPPQLYSETDNDRNNCIRERDELLAENEKMTVENTELNAQLELVENAKKRMEENGMANAEELKILKGSYNQLLQRYNELKQTYQAVISGSDSETRNLMGKLDATQNNLYQREDQLNQLQAKLDNDLKELNRVKLELEQNNAQLLELQRIIAQKDAQAEALKQKLSAALTGFENQGLTITKKNGKVYVSLDEKLLFPSGSTEVDPRGKSALQKLASVLEQNKDINIIIEGHTDDVPIKPGSRYADNWDLSVQRATAIIRILLDGTTIDPKRLTAAGHGEFFPVDPKKTPEARQKNRRTEIILEPNLDEVFELLD